MYLRWYSQRPSLIKKKLSLKNISKKNTFRWNFGKSATTLLCGKSIYCKVVLELDFCGRNPFFGLPCDLKFPLKTTIFQQKNWYARNNISDHKNPNSRLLYNRYLLHITIIK